MMIIIIIIMIHAELCLAVCDPLDCSPPGSSVHGIPQARVLEWVVFSFTGDLGQWTIFKCASGS